MHSGTASIRRSTQTGFPQTGAARRRHRPARRGEGRLAPCAIEVNDQRAKVYDANGAMSML
eukprot:12726197-Heterocapsa_arctica.AAC.1